MVTIISEESVVASKVENNNNKKYLKSHQRLKKKSDIRWFILYLQDLSATTYCNCLDIRTLYLMSTFVYLVNLCTEPAI